MSAIGSGAAIGIGIGVLFLFLLHVGLIIAGAKLIDLCLSVGRVVLSCLASTSAWLIVALTGQPVLKVMFSSVFNNNVSLLLTGLVSFAVELVCLAECLVAIAPVSRRRGWALTLFSVGASYLIFGIVAMIGVAVDPGMLGSLKPLVWGVMGAGLLMLVLGYWQGASQAAGDFVDIPSGYQDSGGFESVSSGPIRPETIYEPSGRRSANMHNVTVVAGSRQQSVATAWIVVTTGSDKGKKVEMRDGDMKIGRAGSCAVSVNGDEEISREHSLIRVSGASYVLYDLASRNGTYLNGARIKEARSLQDGDEIVIGNTTLTFKAV